MAKAEMIDSKNEKWWAKEAKKMSAMISESNQKVALEFLNLDSEDIDALKAFAQKYAEKDPETHVATNVAYFMKGDIEKLRRLQREFRADVLDIISFKPSNKDVTPLYRVAEKLIQYTKDREPEWEIDFTGEHNSQLIEKLPPEKEFPAMLYGWLTHDIIEEGRIIKVCAAVDCENFFVPTPRGRNQEYCSRQCYERIYSRRRYLREKKK